MLRMVNDRETTGNSMQGYIVSRARALEVNEPFHILWRIALNGLEKAGCRGVVAILTTAINAWKGPWMNGTFGREIQEALVFILGVMHPTHPLLRGELANVLIDQGIHPQDMEYQDPDAQMKLLSGSAKYMMAGTYVQWRRFFCFLEAFPELDKSWTARVVCGRFVAPRFTEYLFRAEALLADDMPHPEAECAGASGQPPPMARAEEVAANGEGIRGQNLRDAQVEESDLLRQANGRQALRGHRERHGNMLELSTDALGNRELQFLGRHIYYSTLALYQHYLDSIPALTFSQESVAQWHARRAVGDWQQVLGAILSILADHDILDKCGITVAGLAEGLAQPAATRVAVGTPQQEPSETTGLLPQPAEAGLPPQPAVARAAADGAQQQPSETPRFPHQPAVARAAADGPLQQPAVSAGLPSQPAAARAAAAAAAAAAEVAQEQLREPAGLSVAAGAADAAHAGIYQGQPAVSDVPSSPDFDINGLIDELDQLLFPPPSTGNMHEAAATSSNPTRNASSLPEESARGQMPHAAGRPVAGLLCGPNCAHEDLDATRRSSLLRNVLSQASTLSWYMLPFEHCPPNSFAAFLHLDTTQSQSKMKEIKHLWKSVCELSGLPVRSPGQNRLLKHLYWLSSPLVHESMQVCQANDWDCRQCEVKQMAWEQWAALSDTKRVLEDVFASLKHEASRNKNMKMSRPHSYFAAATSSALSPSSFGKSKVDVSGFSGEPDFPTNLALQPGDWQMPLAVPLHEMGEGMYVTPNNHKPAGLDLKVFQQGVARAAVPWKPAGPVAMQRMAAASCYLMDESSQQWQLADSAWAGILLTTFGIFKDKRSDEYFISLGFNSWMALMLPLECDAKDGTNCFYLKPGCRVKRLSNHDVTNASPFQGIPVEELSPHQCPQHLAQVGIAWQQIHPPMDLVPYAILCRCLLDVPALRGICLKHQIAVQRLPHSKSVTKEAYVMALVRHFFPEEPWETRSELAFGIMQGDRAPCIGDARLGRAAVEFMDQQNQQEFREFFPDPEAGPEAPMEEQGHGEDSDPDAQVENQGRGRGRGRQGKGRGKSRVRGKGRGRGNGRGRGRGKGRGRGRGAANEEEEQQPPAPAREVDGGEQQPPQGGGQQPPAQQEGANGVAGDQAGVNGEGEANGNGAGNAGNGIHESAGGGHGAGENRRDAAKSFAHGPQKNFTPECIKRLVPGLCRIPGVYIVWRRTTRTWESKYPGALPRPSFSKVWDGPKEKLTMEQALNRCLDWMWLQHDKACWDKAAAVQSKPTGQDVKDALQELMCEWARRVQQSEGQHGNVDEEAGPASPPHNEEGGDGGGRGDQGGVTPDLEDFPSGEMTPVHGQSPQPSDEFGPLFPEFGPGTAAEGLPSLGVHSPHAEGRPSAGPHAEGRPSAGSSAERLSPASPVQEPPVTGSSLSAISASTSSEAEGRPSAFAGSASSAPERPLADGCLSFAAASTGSAAASALAGSLGSVQEQFVVHKPLSSKTPTIGSASEGRPVASKGSAGSAQERPAAGHSLSATAASSSNAAEGRPSAFAGSVGSAGSSGLTRTLESSAGLEDGRKSRSPACKRKQAISISRVSEDKRLRMSDDQPMMDLVEIEAPTAPLRQGWKGKGRQSAGKGQGGRRGGKGKQGKKKKGQADASSSTSSKSSSSSSSSSS